MILKKILSSLNGVSLSLFMKQNRAQVKVFLYSALFVLPPAHDLTVIRDQQTVRVITHQHTPVSFDACDENGSDEKTGKINEACITSLKKAFCDDFIDYAFLTDHTVHMAEYEFEKLLFPRASDHLVTDRNGEPYLNEIGNCENKFKPRFSIGFEDRVLMLGMEKHVNASSVRKRLALYSTERASEISEIEKQTSGFSVLPHTEDKPDALIDQIHPKVIEVFNLHALLDPRSRKKSLGLPAFTHFLHFIPYYFDAFDWLSTTDLFLKVYQYPDVYFEKWDRLLSKGEKIIGVGGNDSHENIFSFSPFRKERLDSHRLLLGFLSNHVRVKENSFQAVKKAITSGYTYVAFEGLGTPDGFDFYAEQNQKTYEMGSELHLNASSPIHLTVRAPKVFQKSTQRAQIEMILLHVKPGQPQSQIVQKTQGSEIRTAALTKGAYRVVVKMIPTHIRSYFKESFIWIVSNPVFIR